MDGKELDGKAIPGRFDGVVLMTGRAHSDRKTAKCVARSSRSQNNAENNNKKQERECLVWLACMLEENEREVVISKMSQNKPAHKPHNTNQ